MRRVLAVVVAILVIGIVAPANATPVATNNSEYDLLGRIFPDPWDVALRVGGVSRSVAPPRLLNFFSR